MDIEIVLSKRAQKDLERAPKYIQVLFESWIETIFLNGLKAMQEINGYRDHPLRGNRRGQRSSSLTRSWRVIYKLDHGTNVLTVEILEVNHHDY